MMDCQMLTDFSHLKDDDVKCGVLCLNLWTFESTNPVEAQGEVTLITPILSLWDQSGTRNQIFRTTGELASLLPNVLNIYF